MMKRLALALLLALPAPLPAFAQGVPNSAQVVNTCGTTPATYTAGLNYPLLQNTSGQACTTGTATVSGTVTANQGTPNAAGTSSWPVQGAGAAAAAIVGNPVLVGGSDGTNARALSTDTTGRQVMVGPGTAGTQTGGVLTVQGDPAGTAIPISPSPSSASSIGIPPVVSTAAESGHVLKASAGNLYGLIATAQTSTAGYVMVFNSATVPVDGAVTPIICAPISGSPAMVNVSYGSGPPGIFSTGISVAISSTGCATKTAIASGAWFTGAVK